MKSLKKNIKCKKCGANYDNFLTKCPVCEKPNDTSPLERKFNNMLFLTDFKEFTLFITGFLGLIIFSMLITLGLQNFKMILALRTNIINLIAYLLTFCIMVCIIFHDLDKVLLTLKKYNGYIAGIIACAIIIGFSFAYTAILNAAGVPITQSENQAKVVSAVKTYPAIAFFFVVIFGPITEEFAYRIGAFSILRKRNRYLAYIVTIIIFTLIHFSFDGITTDNIINECKNIPNYLVPAFILCLSYEYFGPSACISAHIINNLISYIVTLAQ